MSIAKIKRKIKKRKPKKKASRPNIHKLYQEYLKTAGTTAIWEGVW